MKRIACKSILAFSAMILGLLVFWAQTLAGQQDVPTSSKSDTMTVDKKPAGVSDEEWEKIKAKRPLPFDNGPSTIDVSAYTPEMQKIYTNIFAKTCSKCHTIARPINAPYALPEEWNKYIRKMMKKPGSGVSPDLARQIYKFLIYDSAIRKKDMIAKKTAEKGAAAQ
jgi:hypothetical protein